MGFHDVRFPEDIAYGAIGGAMYATDIVTLASGHEQRNINWQEARARYNVAHGLKTQQQIDTLIAFFHARKGRAYGFRYKDWADFQAVNVPLGNADGNVTQFQLVKYYASGADVTVRTITKPVMGSVKIYLDSVLQVENSDYTLDELTGIVTFSSAPSSGVVGADFEFDVPVRFDTDQITIRLDSFASYSWQDIQLIEVRE